MHTLEGNQGEMHCVAFHPRVAILASGGKDGTVKLWDVQNGRVIRAFEGGEGGIETVAFDPQGEILVAAGGGLRLWEVQTGKLLRELEGHLGSVSVAFAPQGATLASGGADNTVKIWDLHSGRLLRTLEGHGETVWSLAFDPQGKTLASGSWDNTTKLWDAQSGQLLQTLESSSPVFSVDFDPKGSILATIDGPSVKLWDIASGKLQRSLEGHAVTVECLAFADKGRLLVSKGDDASVRIWSCSDWNQVESFPDDSCAERWTRSLASHPELPFLATIFGDRECIHIWELDLPRLRDRRGQAAHHTTGKIVLVGDHSVGKSALGYRLIHGRFEKQESTHGQQFWVYPELGKRRPDGTECEAILWDFAGQPDLSAGSCAVCG